MEGKRRSFFGIGGCLSISHYIKRNRNGQQLQFLNQLMQSFSRIDTHVLTSYISKGVQLIFFETSKTAISELQRQLFRCIFINSLCNVIETIGYTEKEKLSQRNIDVKILWVKENLKKPPSRGVPKKRCSVLKIYSKFTGEPHVKV